MESIYPGINVRTNYGWCSKLCLLTAFHCLTMTSLNERSQFFAVFVLACVVRASVCVHMQYFICFWSFRFCIQLSEDKCSTVWQSMIDSPKDEALYSMFFGRSTNFLLSPRPTLWLRFVLPFLCSVIDLGMSTNMSYERVCGCDWSLSTSTWSREKFDVSQATDPWCCSQTFIFFARTSSYDVYYGTRNYMLFRSTVVRSVIRQSIDWMYW